MLEQKKIIFEKNGNLRKGKISQSLKILNKYIVPGCNAVLNKNHTQTIHFDLYRL